MSQCGGFNKTSNTVAALKVELTAHLRGTMRPDIYGATLERFYFTFHCPALSESPSARLKIGAHNTKQKAFYCDLYFDDSFGDLSGSQQREYIARNLLLAIDGLETKLKKRRIDYDIQHSDRMSPMQLNTGTPKVAPNPFASAFASAFSAAAVAFAERSGRECFSAQYFLRLKR